MKGGMKHELKTKRIQGEKRVLALMIKLWDQMINQKELKQVSQEKKHLKQVYKKSCKRKKEYKKYKYKKNQC
ncbi:hypothetical protein DY000_02056201 [Brassica cretica]|uniref:TFIIS N-terminal domain-containing protein n=1 Tax=Brassica cretica TaxID=69181 RepID=A0ABQ7A4V6_BRACR|nr:hypothetical protein DY000_02056201 [Brassica cretica]